MIQSSPSRRARVRRLRTSLPPSGSEIASAASLRSPGVPKHSGRPLQHLLRGGGLPDRRQRQRRHDDGQTDPGATPEQLLHEHRQRHAGRVADQIAVEQRAVETALGRLLQYRPRELLPLVVFQRHRADHFLGELVRSPGQVVLRGRGGQVESHECAFGSVASARAGPLSAPYTRGLGVLSARFPGRLSGRRTRTQLCGRKVQDHRAHRDLVAFAVAFAARQQGGIIR